MRSKEIGSEFWNIPTKKDDNLVFSDDTKWFISGRAALDYILRDILSYKNIQTVALPSWCCDSMIEPIIRNNLRPVFYSVTYNNKLIIDSNVDADALLWIDYFGYKTENRLKFDGIIINDVSHSIFTQKDTESDYIFGSLRKWAGFKTGGFALSKKGFKISQNLSTNDEYVNLRIEAMKEKEKYISEKQDSKEYLEIYSKAEEMLKDLYDYNGLKEDIDHAKHFDVKTVKKQRQENATTLINSFAEYAMFKEVKEEDCPLFVSIMVPDGKRDILRRYLIDNNIYCPVHWPISDIHQLNEKEREIYDNELSLVCDQRYNIEDMNYLCEKVKEIIC